MLHRDWGVGRANHIFDVGPLDDDSRIAMLSATPISSIFSGERLSEQIAIRRMLYSRHTLPAGILGDLF